MRTAAAWVLGYGHNRWLNFQKLFRYQLQLRRLRRWQHQRQCIWLLNQCLFGLAMCATWIKNNLIYIWIFLKVSGQLFNYLACSYGQDWFVGNVHSVEQLEFLIHFYYKIFFSNLFQKEYLPKLLKRMIWWCCLPFFRYTLIL